MKCLKQIVVSTKACKIVANFVKKVIMLKNNAKYKINKYFYQILNILQDFIARK